jgi:hypothetical protein
MQTVCHASGGYSERSGLSLAHIYTRYRGTAPFLCGATPPLSSDEDVPLRIFTSTAAQQSMRFDSLTDKCIHHGIKGIVREVIRHPETHFESQCLKFTHVQLPAQAFSHQVLTTCG